MGKGSDCNTGDTGDTGLIPGLGRSLGEGNATHCLKNPMDRGAWWATAQGVTKIWTRLKYRTDNQQGPTV